MIPFTTIILSYFCISIIICCHGRTDARLIHNFGGRQRRLDSIPQFNHRQLLLHYEKFDELNDKSTTTTTSSFLSRFPRGGATIEDVDDDNDEERYSRQFYTLGARAHGLVRSSTMILDGPPKSGLVFECAKNLALSGVGQILFLTSSDDDNQYHNAELDDLGRVYLQSAAAEILTSDDSEEDNDSISLLTEYIRRLNPSVKVSHMKRSDFLNNIQNNRSEFENPVLVCMDRPQSTQLHLNHACHHLDVVIPFVSVETVGVFGRAFCDFGSNFVVVDEDGEVTKTTLLNHISQHESSEEYLVHCIDGERHDVSKGDFIDFDIPTTNEEEEKPKIQCQVTYVYNPTKFRVTFSYSNNKPSSSSMMASHVNDLNEYATGFSRMKTPKKVSFLSFQDSLTHPFDTEIFAPSDLDKSFDMTRRSALMTCYSALDQFVQQHSRLPSIIIQNDEKATTTTTRSSDLQLFRKLCKSNFVGTDEELKQTKEWKKHITNFVKGSNAKFTPIQAVFGALGAQEALKAATGLYNPIHQILLYDCDEVLLPKRGKNHHHDDIIIPASEKDVKKGRIAPGMSYILGKSFAKKLSSKKIFVVGSGAIGCELLKNLSAMGAGTMKSKGGRIIVTDMDTIEKSNLSRQLLFRDTDVGKFKSIAAKESVQRFNPKTQIEVHTSKVGGDGGGGPFHETFWSNHVDIVMNALDNVEARLFMDSQCVSNRKGLVDAGTLGAKGNVQVVVPHQSESYGSSVDPPEPAIPVCTLKNFPYEISHTIQWARDMFDGLFSRRPTQANDYSTSISSMDLSDFSNMLIRKLGEDAAMDAAKEMGEDILITDDDDANTHIDQLRKVSLEWAVKLADKLFNVAVMKLLQEHPPESLDDEGEPFWTGTRRVPKVLSYSKKEQNDSEDDIVNKSIIDFVRYAARLRMETYLPQSLLGKHVSTTSASDFSIEDATMAVERFQLKTTNSDESSNDTSVVEQMIHHLEKPKRILSELDTPNMSLNVADFEKDDDSNGHVAFIMAASNLRALCYGINPVDAMETRRVAGRIVPAMITTTGFVSGLSCIELIKLLQGASLPQYRNSFINLALPFFAFTSPMPAEETAGIGGKTFTIWDRININEGEKAARNGGITLRKVIQRIKKQILDDEDSEENSSLEITNISFGPYMIYANFLHEDDKSVLKTSIFDLVKEAIISGDDIDMDDDDDFEEDDVVQLSPEQKQEIEAFEKNSFIDLSVLVEDIETGEETELPVVRLNRWK